MAFPRIFPGSKRRRRTMAAATGLLLLFAAGWIVQRLPRRPRYVLVVMLDTLRADRLGCYGHAGPISPHIDAFAKESVLFSRAVASGPWTKPSVASMVTGLSPFTHGLASKNRPTEPGERIERLPEEAFTLAEAVSEAGYDTVAFFSNIHIRKETGHGQGYARIGPYAPQLQGARRHVVREFIKARRAERPLFVYLHVMDAHFPYQAEKDDILALEPHHAKVEPKSTPPEALSKHVDGHFRHWFDGRLPERPGDRIAWHYAAGVRRLDARFGALIGDLKKAGLLDEMLVTVIADHGEAFDEHGHWFHGTNLHSYETDIPWIMRFPKARFAGTRVAQLVGIVDVMPTLADALDIKLERPVHGRSVMPLVRGRRMPDRRYVQTGVQDRPGWSAIEGQRFRLILHEDRRLLFDRHGDPREMRNVAAAFPEIARTLEEEFRTTVAVHLAERMSPSTGRKPTDEELEKLKALGYL